MLVSASILSDTLIPSSIVKELNKSKVDFIHLDIMDGKFVDNKTWTYGEIKKIIKDTNKSLDVHLMVEKPSKYISDYALLNTEYLTVHYEITKNLEQIIDEIKSYGLKPGVSIKPSTDVDVLIPFLNKIELVLIMSVEPGKSGQGFIEDTPNKILKLKNIIDKENLKTIISIDGGINNETGLLCKNAGCDMLVSASYIHKDIINNVKILKEI
ncbi:MAG: ribulose-phosphate 3-epimerase [Tenericutes bacterium]|nr:ribulose-phosphate 3-epimerase [Mycoplasmatota bacterium]